MRPSAGIAALALLSLALGAAGVRAQNLAQYVSPPENLPRAIPAQPIAFNHQLHMGAGMKCVDCHTTALKKARAGLPKFEDCMLCHQTVAADRPDVQKLALLAAQKVRVAWNRVYEVPEFVFFNHRKHMAAGLECSQCHGPVESRAVLAQELSVSMTACMNCHAERNVSNQCYFCHELGQ